MQRGTNSAYFSAVLVRKLFDKTFLMVIKLVKLRKRFIKPHRGSQINFRFIKLLTLCWNFQTVQNESLARCHSQDIRGKHSNTLKT